MIKKIKQKNNNYTDSLIKDTLQYVVKEKIVFNNKENMNGILIQKQLKKNNILCFNPFLLKMIQFH